MKTIFGLILSVLSIQMMAQTSISIKHNSSGLAIGPNSVFKCSTAPEDLAQHIFDIKNTSNSTKMYDVKRYDIKLNKITVLTTVDNKNKNFKLPST